MAKRFLTYDTQNPPGNVNEQGVMVGGSGSGKPVFFISTHLDGRGVVLAHYDNHERLATTKEVVDAYMAGTAYFFDCNYNFPSRIAGFGISEGHSLGEVVPKFTNPNDYTSGWNDHIKVCGSTAADLQAAMAKYLP